MDPLFVQTRVGESEIILFSNVPKMCFFGMIQIRINNPGFRYHFWQKGNWLLQEGKTIWSELGNKKNLPLDDQTDQVILTASHFALPPSFNETPDNPRPLVSWCIKETHGDEFLPRVDFLVSLMQHDPSYLGLLIRNLMHPFLY